MMATHECEAHDEADPMQVDDTMPALTPSKLENLPKDCMNVTLSFLYLDEFCILSRVSRRFFEAVSRTSHLYMSNSPLGRSNNSERDSPVVTRRQAVPEAHINQNGLRTLLQRFQSLSVLHLHGLAGVGDSLFSVLNESPTASTLKQISLNGCYLSYWCPTALELDNLTHVNISGGSIRSAFGSFTSSSNLQSLAIGQCSSLRDEHIIEMAYRLHNQLEHLSLHQCLRVKKPQLQFERLKTLKLMGLFSLTNLPKFSCPNLRELSISFCLGLENKVIQKIVSSLPYLEQLSLVKCPLLRSLEIRSPTLKTLNLSLSNSLEILEIICENLSILEMVSCKSLKSVQMASNRVKGLNFSLLSIEKLNVNSSSLQKLKLSGCLKLPKDHCVLQCPGLETVDISGAHSSLEEKFAETNVQVIKGSTSSSRERHCHPE